MTDRSQPTQLSSDSCNCGARDGGWHDPGCPAMRQGSSKEQSVTEQLRNALEFLYDKWENGTSCTDGGEPDGAYIGNAFRLSEREEQWILALIPRESTNPQPPAHETREQLYGWCVSGMYKVGEIGKYGPDDAHYILAPTPNGPEV